MHEFTIPKKVFLAGIEITVDMDSSMVNREGTLGRVDYEDQRIIIDPCAGKDIICQTYLHELTHYILYVMGKEDLRTDEAFVESFSHLLYQAIK